MHQGRNAFCGINRSLTDSVGRIASPVRNPVYPSYDSQNDNCRGAGNEAQTADFLQQRDGLLGHDNLGFGFSLKSIS
jgi:hypothetical protein